MKTQYYKKKLEEEKVRLETKLANMGRRNVTVPDDWEQAPIENTSETDPVDKAEALTERQNDAAVLDTLEARYDAVLDALRRVEGGSFGKCVECAAPIAEQRLEANPSAMTCALHMT